MTGAQTKSGSERCRGRMESRGRIDQPYEPKDAGREERDQRRVQSV